MGCPSKKVVKSEHGIALRKNPDLAFKLVDAVATATNLPVSVKTRLGWSNAEGLSEFGKGLDSDIHALPVEKTADKQDPERFVRRVISSLDVGVDADCKLDFGFVPVLTWNERSRLF